jgi:hypothetical protein
VKWFAKLLNQEVINGLDARVYGIIGTNSYVRSTFLDNRHQGI